MMRGHVCARWFDLAGQAYRSSGGLISLWLLVEEVFKRMNTLKLSNGKQALLFTSDE